MRKCFRSILSVITSLILRRTGGD